MTARSESGGPTSAAARCVIAIAASTGGPRTIEALLLLLPASLPAAVVIVQHMPAFFTRSLAERLDSAVALTVREASEGERVDAGVAYIAPGGIHLRVTRTSRSAPARFQYDDSPPVHGIRPAADPLFTSVARQFGPHALGVVLTGMGRDGTQGLRAIRAAGGWTAVQEAASAVIASMPRSAAAHADATLPVAALATAIRLQAQRRARLAGP